MMIPTPATQALLQSLLNELITKDGQPDFSRFRVLEHIEKRYQVFLELLRTSEDDLSIVHKLVEKDPDCLAGSPVIRLQALVDYVEIATAIYSQVENPDRRSTIH